MTETTPKKPAAKKRPAKKKEPEYRRRFRPHPLGLAVASIARPMIGKRGFADVDILSRWADIVGEDIAGYTLPEKLVKPRALKVGPNGLEGGTLHVRVSSSAFATILKHQEPEVCARINGYFGFKAVGKLKTSIGTIPKRPEVKKRPPPKPLPQETKLLVDMVDNPELRAALEKLGQTLNQDTPDK